MLLKNWHWVAITAIVCATVLIMFFNMSPRQDDPPFWQILLLAPYISN